MQYWKRLLRFLAVYRQKEKKRRSNSLLMIFLKAAVVVVAGNNAWPTPPYDQYTATAGIKKNTLKLFVSFTFWNSLPVFNIFKLSLFFLDLKERKIEDFIFFFVKKSKHAFFHCNTNFFSLIQRFFKSDTQNQRESEKVQA